MAARYCAMRGELLEPGGCSAWPTSAWAAATMRAPTLLPAGAVIGAVAAVALVPSAPWSAEAKLAPLVVDDVAVGLDCGGAKAPSSACIRVRTDSRLTTG